MIISLYNGVMAEQPKWTFSWRLKLILLCGGVLGLALAIFSYHITRMDDTAIGPVPLAWSFKAETRSIPMFFRIEKHGQRIVHNAAMPEPAIDRGIAKETRFALFALG